MSSGEKEQVERDSDENEAESRQSPSGEIVYHAILKEGEDELKRPNAALFWSALAAGMSMGFSLIAEALLQRRLPDATWTPLVAKFGYSIGFLVVVLGRQQLFTENTLTVILPLLREKKGHVLRNVMRLWGVVFAANLAGALLFAVVMGKTQAISPETLDAMLTLSRDAVNHPAGVLFIRAIFAGWLIALMVWLLPFAETARVSVIVIITYLVGIGEFTHVIVGSIESMLLCVMNERSWIDFFWHFLLPAFAGNCVGGVSLVAAINHAQVVAGGGEDA